MSRSPDRSPRDRSVSRSRSRSHSRTPSRTPSRSRSRSPRREDERRHRDDRSRDDNRQDDYRRGRRDDRGESTSVLVRRVNFRSSSEDLKKAFSEFGEVLDVYLPLDYHSRRPRGFGFVQFAKLEDAEAAIRSLDGTEIDGSRVEVVLAQQNRKSPGTMRRMSRRSDDRHDRRSRRDDYDDRRGGYGYRDERRRSRSRSGSRRRSERYDRRY